MTVDELHRLLAAPELLLVEVADTTASVLVRGLVAEHPTSTTPRSATITRASFAAPTYSDRASRIPGSDERSDRVRRAVDAERRAHVRSRCLRSFETPSDAARERDVGVLAQGSPSRSASRRHCSMTNQASAGTSSNVCLVRPPKMSADEWARMHA